MRNVTKNGRSLVPQFGSVTHPYHFQALQVLIQTSKDAWLPSRSGGWISLACGFLFRLLLFKMPPDSRVRHSTSPAVSHVLRTPASRPKTLVDIRV